MLDKAQAVLGALSEAATARKLARESYRAAIGEAEKAEAEASESLVAIVSPAAKLATWHESVAYAEAVKAHNDAGKALKSEHLGTLAAIAEAEAGKRATKATQRLVFSLVAAVDTIGVAFARRGVTPDWATLPAGEDSPAS